MLIKFKDKNPNINNTNFIAIGAILIGDVELKNNSSIWFNCVLRGDDNFISIGENTNIQDLVCIHTEKRYPTIIGDNCTIGHKAVLHGCIIGDNTLIGINAVILDNVKIGNNCLIGANSLVTTNKEIPDNSLVFGNPAKVIRALKPTEIYSIKENAIHYVNLAKDYLDN